MRLIYLVLSFYLCVTGKGLFASDTNVQWIQIPTKKIIPFLSDNIKESSKKEVEVKSFSIAKYATTNLEFYKFVKSKPSWEKSRALKLFVDANYLKHWNSIDFNKLAKNPELDSPVVNVSWFAAKSYCASIGGRLPTTLEWEVAADTENKETISLIMDWYSKTSSEEITNLKAMKSNIYGLYGINGVIWEWVEDFNSVMIATDSRNQPDSKVAGLFCGGGSLNAKDSSNYAAFMRYGFRSAIDGKYTNGLLGFRCVKDN